MSIAFYVVYSNLPFQNHTHCLSFFLCLLWCLFPIVCQPHAYDILSSRFITSMSFTFFVVHSPFFYGPHVHCNLCFYTSLSINPISVAFFVDYLSLSITSMSIAFLCVYSTLSITPMSIAFFVAHFPLSISPMSIAFFVVRFQCSSTIVQLFTTQWYNLPKKKIKEDSGMHLKSPKYPVMPLKY